MYPTRQSFADEREASYRRFVSQKCLGEKIAYCNAFEKNWDTSSKFIGLHLD